MFRKNKVFPLIKSQEKEYQLCFLNMFKIKHSFVVNAFSKYLRKQLLSSWRHCNRTLIRSCWSCLLSWSRQDTHTYCVSLGRSLNFAVSFSWGLGLVREIKLNNLVLWSTSALNIYKFWFPALGVIHTF